MSHATFDSLRGISRNGCSGGHRHFNVMPDGAMYRCVELYYSGAGSPVANLSDTPSVEAAFSSKVFSPCHHGRCFLQCDGQKTEQAIDGKGYYVGWDVDHLGFRGKDYCILQVHLTSICNWRCEYCCAADWMARGTPDLSVETWERTARLLTKHYATGMLLLMGGEPTVHNAWSIVSGILLSSSWHVRVVTNLSLPDRIERFLETVDRQDRGRFLVNVSLHPTQWRDGFDRFEEAIKTITTMGAQVSCTTVDTKENRALLDQMDVENRCKRYPLVWFDYIKDINV